MSYYESKGGSVGVLWETLPQSDHLENCFFWTQVLTHSDLGEEAKRKNDAVELADPEGVDVEGGGGEGPGEEGGVHSSFQGAGKHILEYFFVLEKEPVKLSSLVALQGENVGEEFVA